MVEAVAAGWSAAPSTLCICSLHAAHNACPSLPHLTANPFLSSAKPIYTTTVYNNKTKSNCCCTVSSFCFNAIPEHELGTESRERKLSHRKVKSSAGELGHGLGLQLPPRASAVSVNRVNFLRTSYLTSTALLGAGGGDFGKFGGGEGWGGDGGGGGHSLSTTLRATSAQTDDTNLTPEVEDVILLDVKGMSCGGCASSVKRILESQPQVISATVDLPTEIASVHVKLLIDAASEWQTVKTRLGQSLANCLTSSGFKSSVRGDSTPLA